MAISEAELYRRLCECGGISPDDDEDDAIRDLFAELAATRAQLERAKAQCWELEGVRGLAKEMLYALRYLKRQGVYHVRMQTMIERGILAGLAYDIVENDEGTDG